MSSMFYLVMLMSFLLREISGKDVQPDYDHQTETYYSQFKSIGCKYETPIMPFFSPEHSIDTYVRLIQEAEESLDVLTPGTVQPFLFYYKTSYTFDTLLYL